MGCDLTCFKNFAVKFLATGKSFQSIATKFPHPGLHIAVKYPKAEPKKGKQFINVAASPKIHVTALLQLYVLAIQSVLHCVEYRNIQEKVHIL